jgi:hypothetical protein
LLSSSLDKYRWNQVMQDNSNGKHMPYCTPRYCNVFRELKSKHEYKHPRTKFNNYRCCELLTCVIEWCVGAVSRLTPSVRLKESSIKLRWIWGSHYSHNEEVGLLGLTSCSSETSVEESDKLKFISPYYRPSELFNNT